MVAAATAAAVYYGGTPPPADDSLLTRTVTTAADDSLTRTVTRVVPALVDDSLLTRTVVTAVTTAADDSLTRSVSAAADTLVSSRLDTPSEVPPQLPTSAGYSPATVVEFTRLVTGQPDHLARRLIAAVTELGLPRGGRFPEVDRLVIDHAGAIRAALTAELIRLEVDVGQVARFVDHGSNYLVKLLTKAPRVVQLAWAAGDPTAAHSDLFGGLVRSVFRWLTDAGVFADPRRWAEVDRHVLAHSCVSPSELTPGWFNVNVDFFRELVRVAPAGHEKNFYRLVSCFFVPAENGTFPEFHRLLDRQAVADRFICHVANLPDSYGVTEARVKDLVRWFVPSFAERWCTGTPALKGLAGYLANTAARGADVTLTDAARWASVDFVRALVSRVCPAAPVDSRWLSELLGQWPGYLHRLFDQPAMAAMVETEFASPRTFARAAIAVRDVWANTPGWHALVTDARSFGWSDARVADLVTNRYPTETLKNALSRRPE